MSGLYRHTYEPNEDGKCLHIWIDSSSNRRTCNSTQRSSVLHDDPESDFRMMHYHGGGDCMCFEDEDGPSYYEAMQAYVRGY